MKEESIRARKARVGFYFAVLFLVFYGPENHLHRAVRHMGDGSEYTSTSSTVLPTIPSAFDQYERFREDVPQECNKTNSAHWQNDDCWVPVLRGMPRKGQVT